MHGWTDATASQLLATILTDADDNSTRQAVDPGIVLDQFVFDELLLPLPVELVSFPDHIFYACQKNGLGTGL